ncbi:MAG: carboxypeptidase regulatory-like domain-containing protein [Acidobacteria bacterium]|nr:carboxypeptidase regulatory-like domain-containing protein [Acidobacteriota bacterium]
MPFRLLASVLVFASAAFGQAATGVLTGVVHDPTGAVVPAAKVVATNQSTGITWTTETSATGAYLFPNLNPAGYQVSVEAQGFRRADLSGIRVNAGATVTQPVQLEVGAVTESVQVSGTALQVETTTGTVKATVQVEQILEMPMPSRDVFRLVNLVPGAFMTSGMDGGEVSIGGGRGQSAKALLDGVTNSRGGFAVANIEMAPPIDAMQEFTVQVSAMGAEYGRSSAGFINAVTKSGTNRFHGSLYEFLRNNKLDAAGWGNDTKPKLIRNHFGGTIGGPIRRNKTFFFYNLEAQRQREAEVRTRSVGLPEFQQGDFSRATARAGNATVVVPIHDPSSGSGTFAAPRGTSPFPGNVIPLNRIDPVARAVLASGAIPGPSRPPNNVDNYAGNFQQNSVVSDSLEYHTLRIDHAWTDTVRMFGRWLGQPGQEQHTQPAPAYSVSDPDAVAFDWHRHNISLVTDVTFSPTFLGKFLAGWNRVWIRRRSGDCCETNYSEKFGIKGVAPIAGRAFPRLNFGGGLTPVTQIGAPGNHNRLAPLSQFDYQVDFTKIAGRNTFKWGFMSTYYQGNENSRSQEGGVYGFNGRFTQGYNANGQAIARTGLPFADFLLGRLNSASVNVTPSFGLRIHHYAGYFQDDLQVTPGLTLNFGIRYEVETPVFEVADRWHGFCQFCPAPLAGSNGIPADAVGAVTFAGRDGKGKYLNRWDTNNFAPRFGFSWRLPWATNTVLRGGYGIFYGNPYDAAFIQQPILGLSQRYQVSHPVPFTLGQGIPPGAITSAPESALTSSFGFRGTPYAISEIRFFDEARVTQYSHSLNLNVQTSFRGWFVEVGVIGTLGRHAPFAGQNINQIRAEDLPMLGQGASELSLRPWRIFSGNAPSINVRTPNWGLSNAWLGTLKVERRYQNGLGLTLAYTYTTWIDNVQAVGDTSSGDNDSVQDIYNRAGERSASNYTIPHRLVVAPIWDLPFGRGRKLGTNWQPLLNAAAGGWQVSTIGTLRSGSPFGVGVLNGPRVVLGDSAGGRTLRPDLVSSNLVSPNKGLPLTNGSRGLEWLNPAAFAVPALYTLGNASRTLPGVYGPGSVLFDLMLAKNFNYGERWRLQFRWEMFNFTNTPRFDVPAQTVGTTDFGWVTSAGARRIMQFGLKLYW